LNVLKYAKGINEGDKMRNRQRGRGAGSSRLWGSMDHSNDVLWKRLESNS